MDCPDDETAETRRQLAIIFTERVEVQLMRFLAASVVRGFVLPLLVVLALLESAHAAKETRRNAVHVARASSARSVALVGAPTNLGQRRVGVESAPETLRRLARDGALAPPGWDVHDLGDAFAREDGFRSAADAAADGGATPFAAASAAHRKLADAVTRALGAGRHDVVLALGGDHSVSIGSIAGVLRDAPSTRIVWIDAHADVNTERTSPSGNLHGMALAVLRQRRGLSRDDSNDFGGAYDWLRTTRVPPLDLAKRVTYVGLRELDPGEETLLNALNVSRFTGVDDLRAFTASLASDDDPGSPIHVSLDVDVLDPSAFMPCTGTRARGGLTTEQCVDVLRALAATGRVRSADVVELNLEACETDEERAASAANAAALLNALLE